MGITQHRNGTSNVQQLSNFLMMRGIIGKPGAGICPLRGHSNVQGDRTVGITEIPNKSLLDGMERAFGFCPPAEKGHNAVEAIDAIIAGRSKALICLGGNLAVAMSDPDPVFAGMRKLELAVHLCTKLNRSHLLIAENSLILPVLGRTDVDFQEGGRQSVTVEDSTWMVHASRGFLKPPSEHLRSEPSIIAGMAEATLGEKHAIDWDGMVADYDRIRDKIETVFPDFYDFNKRIREPGGFHLDIPASRWEWRTSNGKANFIVALDIEEGPRRSYPDIITLTTVRSHDQYNTTVYGLNDRYRGVFGRRDVVFTNAIDLEERGLEDGSKVDIVAAPDDGEDDSVKRVVAGFTAVQYDIARGSAAGYFPELNVLVALSHFDKKSGTPSYKATPVHIRAASSRHGDARADLCGAPAASYLVYGRIVVPFCLRAPPELPVDLRLFGFVEILAVNEPSFERAKRKGTSQQDNRQRGHEMDPERRVECNLDPRADATAGTQVKQMTKNAGPSAGSAKE